LRTDENAPQVYIQEKGFDGFMLISGLHQTDAMAQLDSASMDASTLQAYFFYSKQCIYVEETLWISVLAMGESWHQP
jgi:hypothetical protein